MDAVLCALIEALHRSAFPFVIAVTGGGTRAVADLLAVPGGSRTLLEAIIPYSQQSLCEFLGRRPESFCSAETARLMAERARDRAAWLAPGADVSGVACTASLATDRPKRGDHRCHLAVVRPGQTWIRSLKLQKGARDRAEEEAVVDALLLNLLAESAGLAERVEPGLVPGEEIIHADALAPGALAAFLRGEVPCVGLEIDGRARAEGPLPLLLVPGAFNPVHKGHWGLARVASQMTGRPAAFELSVTNVDKPPLAPDETLRRAAQFTWRAPLWLTQAPTFVEKARLFPGAVFAVGADTAERIVSPRYYGDRTEERDRALAELRERGCRFLVAGRLDRDGHFEELQDLTIPETARDLFTPIPASAFRVDVSSTALREEQARSRQ